MVLANKVVARRVTREVVSDADSTRLVAAFCLRGFWDELETRGVSRSELERLSGVSCPRRTDSPAMIPATDMYRFLEASQTLSGDPQIGLTVGRAIGTSGCHILGHLVLASSTVRQAVHAVIRVQPHLRARSPWYEELPEDMLRIGFASRDGVRRPGMQVEAEFAAVLIHDMVLQFFADGTHARPRVEFPFAAPSDSQPYRRVFSGEVRFECEGTYIRFPRSALVRQRSGTDPGLLEHLVELALDQYDVANASLNWTRRVRAALRARNPTRLIDASSVAQQLGVSVRGLSRRLAREGSSLSRLLDEALYDRAQVLLRRPDATAARVADALGYAELSSFFRAFRRWSGGLTPKAYRRLNAGSRRPQRS